MFQTDRFISIPKGVLEKLSKKAQKELKEAIENYRAEGYEHYPEHYGHHGGSPVIYNYHLIEMDDRKAEDAIQTILAMSFATKAAKLKAQQAQDAVDELAKVKDSVKLLKGFIDE